MKSQAASFTTGGDAAASGSALSGRWVAVLVVMALLLVGLAGAAGYTGLAAGLGTSGEGPSAAQSPSTATPAVPPKPVATRADQGADPTERKAGSSRPPPAGNRPTAAAAGDPPALRWPLWEFQLRQPIPPREPPLTPPPWRLVGSATTGPVKQLIILRQGKTAPEFYVKGDSLPGGYVVGEITDEDVTLIHGKRALLLSFIGIR
jgi:hypothetical protein